MSTDPQHSKPRFSSEFLASAGLLVIACPAEDLTASPARAGRSSLAPVPGRTAPWTDAATAQPTR